MLQLNIAIVLLMGLALMGHAVVWMDKEAPKEIRRKSYFALYALDFIIGGLAVLTFVVHSKL